MKSLIILLFLLSSCASVNNELQTPKTLECPVTQLSGFDDHPTKRDSSAFATAYKRCASLYENSPCLKILIKITDGTYRAICGSY